MWPFSIFFKLHRLPSFCEITSVLHVVFVKILKRLKCSIDFHCFLQNILYFTIFFIFVLNICVCVCMCMHACVRARVCTHLHRCECACVHMCVHSWMCVLTQVHACMCVHVHMCMCRSVCMSACVHIRVCMYLCTQVHVWYGVCVCLQ